MIRQNRTRPLWALLVVCMAALVALVAGFVVSSDLGTNCKEQQHSTACLVADNDPVSPNTLEVQGDAILAILPVPAVPAIVSFATTSISKANETFISTSQESATTGNGLNQQAMIFTEAHGDAICHNHGVASVALLNINQTGAGPNQEVCCGAKLATAAAFLS